MSLSLPKKDKSPLQGKISNSQLKVKLHRKFTKLMLNWNCFSYHNAFLHPVLSSGLQKPTENHYQIESKCLCYQLTRKNLAEHISSVVMCLHKIVYPIFPYRYVNKSPGRYSGEVGSGTEGLKEMKIKELL